MTEIDFASMEELLNNAPTEVNATGDMMCLALTYLDLLPQSTSNRAHVDAHCVYKCTHTFPQQLI